MMWILIKSVLFKCSLTLWSCEVCLSTVSSTIMDEEVNLKIMTPISNMYSNLCLFFRLSWDVLESEAAQESIVSLYKHNENI